jgi:hypothetical protein
MNALDLYVKEGVRVDLLVQESSAAGMMSDAVVTS